MHQAPRPDANAPETAPPEHPFPPAKLHRPPLRAQTIPCPQLVARLSAGAAGRLTLLCAPPGYGRLVWAGFYYLPLGLSFA